MPNEDCITLSLIRGEIVGMPEDDQAKVKAAAAQLRAVLEAAGAHGLIALVLVGAEAQVGTL